MNALARRCLSELNPSGAKARSAFLTTAKFSPQMKTIASKPISAWRRLRGSAFTAVSEVMTAGSELSGLCRSQASGEWGFFEVTEQIGGVIIDRDRAGEIRIPPPAGADANNADPRS